MNPDIGNRIKSVRGDRSQQQFAEELGISFRAYRYYESGERIPPGPVLSRLAEISGRSIEWILKGSEAKKVVADHVGESPGIYEINNISEKIVQLLLGMEHDDKAAALELIRLLRAMDPAARDDILKYAREKKIVVESREKK